MLISGVSLLLQHFVFMHHRIVGSDCRVSELLVGVVQILVLMIQTRGAGFCEPSFRIEVLCIPCLAEVLLGLFNVSVPVVAAITRASVPRAAWP